MRKSFVSILTLLTAVAAQAEPMIVEQDFAALYNKFRYAQPAEVPWAGSYFAYKTNGIAMGVVEGYGYKDKGDKSASYVYDLLYNTGNAKAHEFELKNHSCDHLEPEQKKSCEGWWGHCNGWAAAAIKEHEPLKPMQFKGQTLEVGHQKALLTELWLTSNSAFLGETQKARETGEWVYNTADPDYAQFWDVTPRQTVLAFMNQIGAMKTGVVVDRFTGDQVWNQPVSGYRILPLRPQDLGRQTLNGKEFFYAQIRMKVFWANDNVHPGHISGKFNIEKTSDTESRDQIPGDYDQRLLRFKLFFDAPVAVDPTGTKITSAGKLVGDGLWADLETPNPNPSSLDQTHMDFIWLPQTAYIDFSRGYGNPYIGVKQIREVAQASYEAATGAVVPPPAPQPAPQPQPRPQPIPSTTTTTTTTTTLAPAPAPGVTATQFEVEVDRKNVYDGDNALIAERLLLKVFKRASLTVDLNERDVRFNGSRIVFKVFSADAISSTTVKQAFEDADSVVYRIDPIR